MKVRFFSSSYGRCTGLVEGRYLLFYSFHSLIYSKRARATPGWIPEIVDDAWLLLRFTMDAVMDFTIWNSVTIGLFWVMASLYGLSFISTSTHAFVMSKK